MIFDTMLEGMHKAKIWTNELNQIIDITKINKYKVRVPHV